METRFTLEELNTVSEIEIVYKNKSKCKITERPQIISSKDAYDILLHYWNPGKIELIEEFKVIYMNRANRVLRIMNVSSGSFTATVADARIILVPAIKMPTSGIILAHNHPSGQLKPSQADIDLTSKIMNCAKMFDIRLADHVIVTNESYYSFADQGLL
jgi:DNA repair protein RadC